MANELCKKSGHVKVWMIDGTCTQVLDKHLGAVVNACFSPDGSRIITATQMHGFSPYQSLPVPTSPYQFLPVPTSTWWIPGHTWQWYAMMLLVQRVIKNEKSSKVSNATLRQTNIAIGHPLPMEAQWKNHLCHGAYALVSMVIVIVY